MYSPCCPDNFGFALFKSVKVLMWFSSPVTSALVSLLSWSQNQQGKIRQHNPWRGTRHMQAIPVLLFTEKFSFFCMFYWQWCVPGMLDWHQKTLKQSKGAQLCKQWIFIYFLDFGVSCYGPSALLADVWHILMAQLKPSFPCTDEGGVRRILAYWC